MDQGSFSVSRDEGAKAAFLLRVPICLPALPGKGSKCPAGKKKSPIIARTTSPAHQDHQNGSEDLFSHNIMVIIATFQGQARLA